MNPAIYVSIMLALFVIILCQRHRIQYAAAARLIRKKQQKSDHHKENTVMYELAQKFVGHAVTVYTLNGDCFEGTITTVTEDALLLDCKRSTDVISLNYVTRIREVKPK